MSWKPLKNSGIKIWESIGFFGENGVWSIKQNKEGTVDFRQPTHWKAIFD